MGLFGLKMYYLWTSGFSLLELHVCLTVLMQVFDLLCSALPGVSSNERTHVLPVSSSQLCALGLALCQAKGSSSWLLHALLTLNCFTFSSSSVVLLFPYGYSVTFCSIKRYCFLVSAEYLAKSALKNQESNKLIHSTKPWCSFTSANSDFCLPSCFWGPCIFLFILISS